MENRIIRSIEGNELVIDCDNMSYKLQMLERNHIPGLLPLRIKENDGEKQLCYDITSRESFGSIAVSRTLRNEDVKAIVYSLSRILRSIDEYLLDCDDLVLDKDFIYVCSDDLDPRLCYLPGHGESFSAGLSNLLQDVLGMVDHNDHEAVVLAYSLYQESLKPGYVMEDLIRLLHTENTLKKEEKKEKVNEGEIFEVHEIVNIPEPAKTAPQTLPGMFITVSKPGRRKKGSLLLE